jgi:hypothetical protein
MCQKLLSFDVLCSFIESVLLARWELKFASEGEVLTFPKKYSPVWVPPEALERRGTGTAALLFDPDRLKNILCGCGGMTRLSDEARIG